LFELIVNAGNSAQTLKGILGTQLLTPLRAAACESSTGCSSDTVSVISKDSFRATDGPARYTQYALLLAAISLMGCLIFTPFFPASETECRTWKAQGEVAGIKEWRGYVSVAMVLIIIGVSSSIFLLDIHWLTGGSFSTEL
jgi:hypothetical protein